MEDLASRLGLPDANLSSAQMKLRSVRVYTQSGCAVGITIGCIIGMFPLLLMDPTAAEKRKKSARLDLLFKDVVNEAKGLVNAEATTLFILEGQELYAKYVGDGEKSEHIKEIRIPVGEGIAGRVALTGEVSYSLLLLMVMINLKLTSSLPSPPSLALNRLSLFYMNLFPFSSTGGSGIRCVRRGSFEQRIQ